MANQQTHGGVTLLVVLLSWTLNALFGILIARAVYRAYALKSNEEYLHVVFLNDSLERIRSAIIHEVISWGGIA